MGLKSDNKRLYINSRVVGGGGAMAWVEGSPEEITAKLALLSDKLGHRLLEIRERAIASLNFKLSNDLMTFEDVGSDSGVLRALLDWFAHEDAVPTDDRALAMLRRIVEEEPTAAARLQNLGAEAALLEVADGRCSRQLAAQIESLVEKIATGGVADASAEAPAADAPEPETMETTETTDAPDDEKDDDEEAPDDEEEAPDVEEEEPAEEEDSDEQESKVVEAEEPKTEEPKTETPNDDDEEDDDPAMKRLNPALKDMFLKNPRLATAYWNIVRDVGLEGSDEKRAAAVAAAVDPDAAIGDSRHLEPATRGGNLRLHRVKVSPHDDAKLLELSVRLGHADDPCLLAAALADFEDRALRDLPPQVLLQRPKCLRAVISLARAREGPTAQHNVYKAMRSGSPITPTAIRSSALRALKSFAAALKGALGHASDGAHAVRLEPAQCDGVEDLLGPHEHSYPPPVLAPREPGHDALYTLSVAHLLANAVVPILAEPAVAGDALLVLQETLPLLELTPADCGDEGGISVDVDAVAARLGVYTSALEKALGSASANVSASGEDELLPTGECPVFFPALAMTAVMITAGGTDAAATATHQKTIPARLVTRLETAAIDELLAAAVPGLRKVSLAALDVLGRHASAAECAAAEAAERATHAAETASKDDAAVAASRSPGEAARMTIEALPALDFIAEDESEPLAARLIATLLTATASATAAAPEDADLHERRRLGDGVEDARLATAELLRSVSAAARRGAYAALAAAAEIAMAAEVGGAAAAVSAAARAVMVGPAVTGEIVSGGLSDPHTRLNAAKCLNAIAAGFGGKAGRSESPLASAAAKALLPWLPWLECDLDDDVVGPATSAAAAAAVRAAPADAWTPLEPLLRGLFHKSARRRSAAADGLARAMGDAVTPPPHAGRNNAPDAEGMDDATRAWVDPFGAVLRHNENFFAIDFGRVRASEAAASVFGGKDVGDLLEVMTNDTLGPSVRVLAGDQLALCATDKRLHSTVCSPKALSSLSRLAATNLSTEFAGEREADIGVAALKVLATCVRHSREARVFFTDVAHGASPDGVADMDSSGAAQPYGRASLLLPLVFHPRDAVREHLSVFCAYVVFGKVADLATTHAGLGVAPEPAAMHVPASIANQLRFPIPVKTIDREALNAARAEARTSPLEAEGTDRARVRAMLAQRREVRRLGGAAGVLRTVEQMMYDAGAHSGAMGPAAKVADSMLRWASPASSAMVSLARLAHARSHEDAVAAVGLLRGVLAFGPPGANAVLAAAWPAPAARLLHTPPRSPEDARLWASLASTLAEAMRVATAPAPPAQLARLAEAVKHAAVPAIHRVKSGTLGGGRFAPGFIATPGRSPPGNLRHQSVAAREVGEAAAASAAAAKAACELAARVLDAAVAAGAAASYGGYADDASAAAAEAARLAGIVLCDTDVVEVVTDRLIVDTSAEYGARLAGAECLASCARACALAVASRPESDMPIAQAAADLAELTVEPLLTYCCTARIGVDPEDANPPTASTAGRRIEEEKKGLTGATGGAIVDAGIAALDAVCEAAPGAAWSRAWASMGATFWLTRLARDRAVHRRASAWRLLSRAACPAARATCALLAKAWPEAPRAGVRVALDGNEAPAVRAAACQFVAACLSTTAAADPLTLLKQPVPDVVPLLNRREVWRGFAEILIAAAGKDEDGKGHPYAAAAVGGDLGTEHPGIDARAPEPEVTDPAAAAALRRGAAAALLACSRLSPVIVGVAMSPRRSDSPAEDGVIDNWPAALSAALRALDPATWRTCLAAPLRRCSHGRARPRAPPRMRRLRAPPSPRSSERWRRRISKIWSRRLRRLRTTGPRRPSASRPTASPRRGSRATPARCRRWRRCSRRLRVRSSTSRRLEPAGTPRCLTRRAEPRCAGRSRGPRAASRLSSRRRPTPGRAVPPPPRGSASRRLRCRAR